MQDKKRAALSIAANISLIAVVSAGIIGLSVGAVLAGAWWMILLIIALIAWGVIRPRRRP